MLDEELDLDWGDDPYYTKQRLNRMTNEITQWNWENSYYRRVFCITSKIETGERVWFKTVYSRMRRNTEEMTTQKHLETVSEEEYIVRKLAGTLNAVPEELLLPED